VKVFLTQLRARSEAARENFRAVAKLIGRSRHRFSPDDILVLPELIGGDSGRKDYEQSTIDLAQRIGCHVVGGTYHQTNRGTTINSGIVADSRGTIVAAYDKLRPYGIEGVLGVVPGKAVGQFEIKGCRVLILVCADFWYSKVFIRQIRPRPDLILVPTFSISRRSSPRMARSLWRSMAIARAYEFSVYVGISDWAYPCEYHGSKSCSVAGLANPRPADDKGFFDRIGDRSLVKYELDLPRLRELRRHRNEHAFLSDEMLVDAYESDSS
jgi:predicted amidohydrolase